MQLTEICIYTYAINQICIYIDSFFCMGWYGVNGKERETGETKGRGMHGGNMEGERHWWRVGDIERERSTCVHMNMYIGTVYIYIYICMYIYIYM